MNFLRFPTRLSSPPHGVGFPGAGAVTKFPDMFVYADEDRIALRSEWQHDDKKLPMAYFDFGYSAADIKQLCAAAKKHCTTQNEQLPSCANRVE